MKSALKVRWFGSVLFAVGLSLSGGCGEKEAPEDAGTPQTEASATGAPAPATRTPPATAAKLAVQITGGANADIYTVDADGSGLTRLTDLRGFDGVPVWSPDGKMIAFMSDRAGEPPRGALGVYVMNADGSGQRLVFGDLQPQLGTLDWSPDGRHLAFAATQDANWEIFTVNVDGSGFNRLTANDAYDDNPVWSPDGRRIAFVSRRERVSNIPNFSPQDIYVMNFDGSGQTRINKGPEFDQLYSAGPRWSPDGRRIAFYSEGPGGSAIRVVDADGGNPATVASTPRSVSRPAWSPDGRMLAFYSLDGAWSIEVMNPDGSGRHLVTDQAVAPPSIDRTVVWSPDGRRIAFVSQTPSGSRIDVTNLDGSGRAPLVATPPEGTLFIDWVSWPPR